MESPLRIKGLWHPASGNDSEIRLLKIANRCALECPRPVRDLQKNLKSCVTSAETILKRHGWRVPLLTPPRCAPWHWQLWRQARCAPAAKVLLSAVASVTRHLAPKFGLAASLAKATPRVRLPSQIAIIRSGDHWPCRRVPPRPNCRCNARERSARPRVRTRRHDARPGRKRWHPAAELSREACPPRSGGELVFPE